MLVGLHQLIQLRPVTYFYGATCPPNLASPTVFTPSPSFTYCFSVFVRTLFFKKKGTMGISSRPKLSGLQKQVLSLYRAFLRAARSKSAEDRRQIESVVSAEFHRNANQIDRKNFIYIEYLLRRGNRQLDQLNSPATVRLSSLNLNPSRTPDSET